MLKFHYRLIARHFGDEDYELVDERAKSFELNSYNLANKSRCRPAAGCGKGFLGLFARDIYEIGPPGKPKMLSIAPRGGKPYGEFLVRAAFRTSDRGRSLAIEHRRRTIADEDSEPPPTPDYTRNDAYSGQIFLAWVGGDDEDAMLYECKVGS